ncbi:GNAT family N-acetyltransferase [Antarcticibacterium arcticum]|uniref:GNAT family N-acetyltransferase n=1 Tax=Antarcticibacterium arcticum TaxID=2585771 RepID=A0A5B8YEN7_9FLAO|nr:GNAT family N-acetyltransferase [Antarcticibacterium arcticum]QED36254.1 GNAT family N-acetyltransferase [Antarcticibacterium arcticum]
MQLPQSGYKIKEISPETTYEVRRPVLRPGRPPAECFFEGDNDPDTFHLGLYKENELIGVASFMKTASKSFLFKDQFQLRGMAVLPFYKGKGYGAALLKEGEIRIKKITKEPFLWFNARDYAVGFYEKFGYQTFGEKFDIPGVCPHIIMYKHL